MAKYRTKPIMVDAVQWLGNNIDKVFEIVDFDLLPPDSEYVKSGIGMTFDCNLEIPTLDGIKIASIGDWIICDSKNEISPCNPDIFKASYDLVEEPIPDRIEELS